MTKIYSYVLRFDNGAAPNPFWGICTLTICKPAIRRNAQIGDWVVGTGSKKAKCNDGNIHDLSDSVVYAMKISDIKTLQDYDTFCNISLLNKIPYRRTTDWRFAMGDCIYDYSQGQKPTIGKSVHNETNRKRDLSGINALLSNHFYYFGEEARVLPDNLTKKVYARLNVDEHNDWRKEFRVRYPIIEGINSESVLHKINSIISYEKVFDVSITEAIEDDFWLNDLDYSVQFIRKPFLNLMLYMEGIGAYPWTVTQSIVINYVTGDLIKIEDIFNENSLERLALVIDEFRQIDFKKAKLEEKYIGEISLNESDNLTESDQNSSWLEEMHGQKEFTIEDLNEFSLNEYGITFIYHFNFPHVIKGLEPEGKYHFGYESLKQFIKKDSVLERFIKENLT